MSDANSPHSNSEIVTDSIIDPEVHNRRKFIGRIAACTLWTAGSVFVGSQMADPSDESESSRLADRRDYLLRRLSDRLVDLKGIDATLNEEGNVITITASVLNPLKNSRKEYIKKPVADISVFIGGDNDPPYVVVNHYTHYIGGTTREQPTKFLLTDLNDNQQIDEICRNALGDHAKTGAIIE